MPSAVLKVDAIGHEAFIDQLNSLQVDTREAVRKAAYRTSEEIVVQLSLILQAAASDAGVEAFPLPYALGMFQAASLLRPSVALHFYSFDLEVDLERHLGDYQDLSLGFHYKAADSQGNLISLPYLGESLKNPYEERLRFWEAVRRGITDEFQVIDASMWTDTMLSLIHI